MYNDQLSIKLTVQESVLSL